MFGISKFICAHLKFTVYGRKQGICPIELDFKLCVTYGLAYTYTFISQYVVLVYWWGFEYRLAYRCVACISTYQLNLLRQKCPLYCMNRLDLLFCISACFFWGLPPQLSLSTFKQWYDLCCYYSSMENNIVGELRDCLGQMFPTKFRPLLQSSNCVLIVEVLSCSAAFGSVLDYIYMLWYSWYPRSPHKS